MMPINWTNFWYWTRLSNYGIPQYTCQNRPVCEAVLESNLSRKKDDLGYYLVYFWEQMCTNWKYRLRYFQVLGFGYRVVESWVARLEGIPACRPTPWLGLRQVYNRTRSVIKQASVRYVSYDIVRLIVLDTLKVCYKSGSFTLFSQN